VAADYLPVRSHRPLRYLAGRRPCGGHITEGLAQTLLPRPIRNYRRVCLSRKCSESRSGQDVCINAWTSDSPHSRPSRRDMPASSNSMRDTVGGSSSPTCDCQRQCGADHCRTAKDSFDFLVGGREQRR
jgi:hypothetical protein